MGSFLRQGVVIALAAFVLSGGGVAAFSGEGPTLTQVRAWDWAQQQPWTDIAARPERDAARQVRRALELEKEKKWTDAAGHYFLAVKAWPTAPEAPVALQRLAVALYALRDHHRAFRAVDQIFDSYPDFAKTPAQPENLLSIELKVANRLVDLADEPPILVEYTVAGVYVPTPEEYRDQAANAFDTMTMRLDALLTAARRAKDDDAAENYLALARAVAEGRARLAGVRVVTPEEPAAPERILPAR